MVVQMMLYGFDIGIVLDDSTNAARKASDIVLTVQGLRAVFQRKNNGRSYFGFVGYVCVCVWGGGGYPAGSLLREEERSWGAPPIYFRSLQSIFDLSL